MISTMKERYEELKEYPNIILNYDEILLFYPDYYKTKIRLEKESFISKRYVDRVFEENYRNSRLFNMLNEMAMADDEIYNFMSHNKNVKYFQLKAIFDKLVEACISLCDLIDYIGHYPTTYPVPKEDEKDVEMESLFDRYDIMVRHYLGDVDEAQIEADDIVRIVDRLEDNLSAIQIINDKISTDDWLFTREVSDEQRAIDTEKAIDVIESFPLSCYQKQNRSKREEGKKYLRLQHGINIS